MNKRTKETIKLFEDAISATAEAKKKQDALYSYLYKLAEDDDIDYYDYEQICDVMQSYLAEEISQQTMFPCEYSFNDICKMIHQMYE